MIVTETNNTTGEDAGSVRAAQNSEEITILLVDDDADCRMLLRDAIAQCKLSNSVYEVSNGREALDFLYGRGQYGNAPRPGLIYLDIQMPGMNGQEVLKCVKADPALRDIPIVMMTGMSDAEQMRMAAANGANSYTVKPTNAEQFLRTVLASTNYWLTIHQYPQWHLSAAAEQKLKGLAGAPVYCKSM